MTELKSQKTVELIANDGGSRSYIHTLVLRAVTVGGLYFCYLLAVPFVPVRAWALALAFLFAPHEPTGGIS